MTFYWARSYPLLFGFTPERGFTPLTGIPDAFGLRAAAAELKTLHKPL
jgi:hypothetical protein